MFERKSSPDLGQNNLAKLCLTTQSGEPVEFIYQGVRFHINQVLTTWLQSSNWWQPGSWPSVARKKKASPSDAAGRDVTLR